MVSKRCFHRSNLYRAICHSFKNFLSLLSPVIDSTREEQASVAFQTAFAVSHAPVWCFSFRSLFNLQGTRSTTAEQSLSYHMSAILSTTFFIFFRCLSSARFRPDRCLSRTARLDYHILPRLSTLSLQFLSKKFTSAISAAKSGPKGPLFRSTDSYCAIVSMASL